MVHSLKLAVITDGEHLTDISFTHSETICFGSLELTVDRSGNLSLSNEGKVLVAMFVGFTDEVDTTSSRGGRGSYGFPISHECNVVTLTIPITTTPLSKGTPALLTITTLPLGVPYHS
jgi:hypothetical protein